MAIIRRLNRQERLPANLYIHPWELDPEQPVIPTRLVTRLRHRIGLSAVERRLEAMIERLPFGTLSESLQSWGNPRPLALGESAPETMSAPVPSLR
ncbi:MAG: DUF3473 domain-containing protein [Acidobacteria bacterium]|nr:DUF3473 domain-containing protein [Acidobacteriota bacterium]